MSEHKPPRSKRVIADLHRKAKVEVEAKNKMYEIAVNSIKMYLKALDNAGKIVDSLNKQYVDDVKAHIRFESDMLDHFRAFVNHEAYLTTISFREYLERRVSGRILTMLFVKIFKNSHRKRFKEELSKFDELAKHYNQHNIPLDYSKQIQRFHIMQDIISENKYTEEMMLFRHHLQRNELITIIDSIKSELRGLTIE